MNRTLFACIAACLALATCATALAQSDQNGPPPQEMAADANYVFDGHSSTQYEMKQIYNRKDGTHVYFGEVLGYFQNTCGTKAFCNNILGHDTDLRLGIQVANPDVYFAMGYGTFHGLGASLTGLGIGLEKLTHGKQPLEWTGAVFWYPSMVGSYACPAPVTTCGATLGTSLDYSMVRYSLGGQYNIGTKPYYVNFGVTGDNGSGANQPFTANHGGAYLGLGLRM